MSTYSSIRQTKSIHANESKTHLGLGTIATAIGEDSGTLEEVYEPFLIKEGFLKRTPRGREVTELAYKHLGKSVYQNIRGLFD